MARWLAIRANVVRVIKVHRAWLMFGYLPLMAIALVPSLAAAGDGATDPKLASLIASWRKPVPAAGRSARPKPKPIALPRVTSHAAMPAISSQFGFRRDPFLGRAAGHAGLDLPRAAGSAVIATAAGRVSRAGWLGSYGNLVEVDHGNGYTTRYGHLSAILVRTGQTVRRGALIARVGSTGRSTGPHLHYEVRYGGQPVNPLPYVRAGIATR